MRAKDSTAAGHHLEGVYDFLLARERNHVDPRLHFGRDPEEVRVMKASGPGVRPARLARLERGDPTLVPAWWLGGNNFPEAARWDTYGDRSIRGWQVSADDMVVPVGHDDPRWDEPGNRL